MDYLHKFNFFDPVKTDAKRELFISSNSIDFFTWHKQKDSAAEGTRLQTNIPFSFGPNIEFIAHTIEGVPENVNQIAMDGLFFKCSVQYLAADGAFKKYTSWINPHNFSCMYQFQPDCTELFFSSGQRIMIANKQPEIMKALLEHNKKYKERKKMGYGKTK